MTIEFTVPGRPVPMARPRVTARGTYTPKRCRDYKTAVAIAAKAAMRGKKPLEGAVHIILQFTFLIPKSWPKVKRLNGGLVGHTSRPDWDNLSKSVTDALIGIVYNDDSQIVSASVEKRYGDDEGVRVVVEEEVPWERLVDDA
jgi:Holliday junction resolvase RusA-like endonuclease